MIISINKFQYRLEEKEIFEKLIEDFNNLSKELNLKYKLILEYDFEAKLIKSLFWNFGDSLGDNKIFYDSYSEEFYFYEGIDEELFKEIKPILLEIKQKFKIETI